MGSKVFAEYLQLTANTKELFSDKDGKDKELMSQIRDTIDQTRLARDKTLNGLREEAASMKKQTDIQAKAAAMYRSNANSSNSVNNNNSSNNTEQSAGKKGENANKLDMLDEQRLRLGKELNESEQQFASNESKLTRLKNRCKEIQQEDLVQDGANDYGDGDATQVFRLLFYRDLGFTPKLKEKKLLVRADASNEVYSFDTVSSKTNQFHLANSVWSSLGSE